MAKTLEAATRNKVLNLGQINFINCLPVNYPLSKLQDCEYDFQVTDSSPAVLNQMLREGELDLAPVSSFEYLKNQEQYDLIDGISISSKKQADSVLFLSKTKNFSKKIYLTNKSASSVNLLKIILAKSYGFKLDKLEFEYFNDDHEELDSKLLIGDEALKADQSNYEMVIDLGKAWYELTSLPMVFGLWTANKGSVDIAEISELLISLKNQGLGELYPDLIIEAYKITGLPKAKLLQYFENLDYDFSLRHDASLELYKQYLEELDLL